MRRLQFATLLALAAFTTLPAAAELTEIKLWPKGIPEGSVVLPEEKVAELKAAEAAAAEDGVLRVRVVTDPTMTVYPAPNPNGCAVVVCPGGGYNILAYDKEGTEIAEWLNTLGVTGVVLKYRVPRRDPDTPHAEPLQDVQRALRLVRHNAEAWEIDPARVGVLGFSAGGHLTVMAGTHWDEQTYAPVDAADKLSCRPDFMVPIYAAYLKADANNKLDPLVRITKDTPPAFMAVSWDDAQRGLESALLFAELKRAGVHAEVHVYSRGGHGYGLRPSDDPVQHWPKLCADWMRVSGFLTAAE